MSRKCKNSVIFGLNEDSQICRISLVCQTHVFFTVSSDASQLCQRLPVPWMRDALARAMSAA
jgi:hypothetical protein